MGWVTTHTELCNCDWCKSNKREAAQREVELWQKRYDDYVSRRGKYWRTHADYLLRQLSKAKDVLDLLQEKESNEVGDV